MSDLAAKWAEAFRAMVALTVRHAEDAGLDAPPFDLAPCWHACRRLEEQGTPASADEAVMIAAFWEWLAWAADELYQGDAEDFAIECRAMADSAVLA
ncbi:MAG TPA: hypothetical protein PK308_00265 [Phycisphaerales bacterium]|nr:hypothetical protein [Phycisphaerales bacterium]